MHRSSESIASLAGALAKAQAELVWTAGALSDSDWANELHPKPAAFSRLVSDCWSGPARKALGLPG